MYGILLKNSRRFEDAQRTLRRFQLYPRGLSKSHSVAFLFSDTEDCIRSLQALEISGIRARIAFHILA